MADQPSQRDPLQPAPEPEGPISATGASLSHLPKAVPLTDPGASTIRVSAPAAEVSGAGSPTVERPGPNGEKTVRSADPSAPTVIMDEKQRRAVAAVAVKKSAEPGAGANPGTAGGPAATPTEGKGAGGDNAAPGDSSWKTQLSSWGTSIVVHATILVLLALWLIEAPRSDRRTDLVATSAETFEDVEELTQEVDQPTDTPSEAADIAAPIGPENVDAGTLDSVEPSTGLGEVSIIGLDAAPSLDLSQSVGQILGNGLAGRGEGARTTRVTQAGGTPASEQAVARALAWLAEHQNSDGSWSINHQQGHCQGRCANPGTREEAHIAATALGLLPFLGAGNTHHEGKYKANVNAAIYYLLNRIRLGANGGDLAYEPQGNMYGHGLASIALCEAYAMTEDRALAGPAQSVLNYIIFAQDPVGGGWRYGPREPGDTSVVGWQLMALKSGTMKYLQVPPATIKGAENFLNTVQVDSGSSYGYTDPGKGHATTAIGLLCRMYLGWDQSEPALERGVNLINEWGPDRKDMYYDYYATQVMMHYTGGEGEVWDKWNTAMRDFLIESQAKEGHEMGSWHFDDRSHANAAGGRLYQTALATMILEVYYRHLPIYRKTASEDDFSLD